MKIFYLTIFFLGLLSFGLKGQSTFQKLIYTEFPATTYSAVFPTDSCYYISSEVIDTTSPLRLGIMFTKLDIYGEPIFNKVLKHPDKNFSYLQTDLIGTSDGNFIRVGIVGDSITRAKLIKYSPEGDTLLSREYKSIRYPGWWYLVPKEVCQRPDGGYGMFIGHQEEEDEAFDLSLLILDSSYQVLSYTSYGLPFVQETARSMILDDDGGYLLGADRTNDGQVLEGFDSRTLIIKTDSVGNVMWEYLSPPGKLRAEANAMIKTLGGGLVVATGIGTEVIVNPGFHQLEWDAMIFKLDADRNVVWETPFRGSRHWALTRLVEMVEAPDNSGYVALGKAVDSNSGSEPLPSSWLIKVSPEGDSLWARYFTFLDGTYIDPKPFDLKPTPDGGYVAVGNTLRLGLPVPGWILKVDEHGCLIPGCQLQDDTTSVGGGLPISSLELAVFPNPVSDLLNFELRNGRALQKVGFRILDVMGRAVRTFQSDRLGSTFVLDVSGWKGGVYFLQYIEGERVLLSEKFIVSH